MAKFNKNMSKNFQTNNDKNVLTMTNKKRYNKSTRKKEKTKKMKSQKPNYLRLETVYAKAYSLKGYFEYAKILIKNIKSQLLCIIFCNVKIYAKVPVIFAV